MSRAAFEDDPGLRTYFSAIQHEEPLSRDEEQRLARLFHKTGDSDAANRLVSSNLRFVVKIALGYRGYGFRLADLIEEGNVGLLESVRRFDPNRNLRFMTYASYWIRAYILAHVLRQSSMVGVGTGPLQSKLFFRMARERARIASALGVEGHAAVVDEKLARKFGTTTDYIRSVAWRLEGKDQSLDGDAFRDSSATVLEFLADERSEGQEIAYQVKERDSHIRARVAAMMAELPRREQYIVTHRLFADEVETLADIGRHLDLSRERVRQLEERLKEKLRRALADLAEPPPPAAKWAPLPLPVSNTSPHAA